MNYAYISNGSCHCGNLSNYHTCKQSTQGENFCLHLIRLVGMWGKLYTTSRFFCPLSTIRDHVLKEAMITSPNKYLCGRC